MGFYIAMKKNELLIQIQTMTWINLTGIILRERSQTQKSTDVMIPFV